MYTTQQAVAAVYALLRTPTQEQLYYEDVRDRLNALLKGYVQDMDLSKRAHRTVVEEVEVVEDDVDFLLSVPNVPDFEAEKLEVSPPSSSNYQDWYEFDLVPLAAWGQHFGTSRRPLASVYGSSATPEGVKLRLNLTTDMVAESRFRLTYRLPLLAEVQMGERPPIPENFMPMLEYDGALDCMDIVKDDSRPWVDWVARVTPKYIKRSGEEHGRWLAYLNSSVEDPVQPLVPFDNFRRGAAARGTRGYLPPQ